MSGSAQPRAFPRRQRALTPQRVEDMIGAKSEKGSGERMQNQDAVRVTIEDAIATVMLNRPEALNALNQDVFLGLRSAAQSIKENASVRAVIVTGAGEKAFSAGIDLKMVAAGGGGSRIVFANYREGFDRLYNLKMIFTMYEEWRFRSSRPSTASAWARGWNSACAAT